jgi:Ca2+-binding EF-hand superfamily protein
MMRLNRFLVLLIGIYMTTAAWLPLLQVNVAQAIPPETTPVPEFQCKQNFMDMDANKDGKVDVAEFMKAQENATGGDEAMFLQLDRNSDGNLTLEEYCGPQPARAIAE